MVSNATRIPPQKPPEAGEKSIHKTISHTVGIMPEDSQPLMLLGPARQPHQVR
jgi:hypothetical protein